MRNCKAKMTPSDYEESHSSDGVLRNGINDSSYIMKSCIEDTTNGGEVTGNRTQEITDMAGG